MSKRKIVGRVVGLVLFALMMFVGVGDVVAKRIEWSIIDDRRVAPETVCRDGMTLGVACVTGGCNGSPSAGLQSLTDLNGLTAADQTSFSAGTIPIELTLADGSVVSAEAAPVLDYDPILLDIGGTGTQWEMASHHTFLEVTWPRAVPANTSVLIDQKVTVTVAECFLNGYIVQKGDTLAQIARNVYNDAARWREIYEANSDSISSPHRLKVGQMLIIP
ncbi:MAG: LysM peptidoglycan-binding domain-containing protein [Anaerolineae bacterium]|nr:LysM peptidoglycan-binding domain-containing protein [Anaerolineae bacterium]MCO5193155.1 LysM peptidoglycan-binding domain-containing protein [Anaerolineae bacterium]